MENNRLQPLTEQKRRGIEQLAEIFSSLPEIQKDILKLKMEGYSSQESCFLLGMMKLSMYYKELEQIQETLREYYNALA